MTDPTNQAIGRDELRDKITELVFDWNRDVQKIERGKTISFWHDEAVMDLIDSYIDQALTAQREEIEGKLERYCTICFNPCFWTKGGHKCVLHGYSHDDLMTANRAAEFKAIIESEK